MKMLNLTNNLKPLAITYISVIAFSNFVFVLFSQTIRDIIWSFFKMTGETVILELYFCSHLPGYSKQDHIKSQSNIRL